eukprot:TRINITY_DN28154_c0_g1_i1.p1 TRINITY_DN28154_c0_g1~~TRINITY_DN28154_c0_g1_i1.p1  ORF type:complete len:444 (+),score=90.52 TRINITY_DN28154_c0_g1_i1:141-1472(+)
MEALCSIFDAVSCVGELFERGEVKDQEMSSLSATVESIAQSVRCFAADLRPEERENVFHSNKVWNQILQQLQACDKVIAKHRQVSLENGDRREQLKDGSGSPRTAGQPVVSALRRTFVHSRSTVREGLEVLGGRLGAFGAALKLPEDELAVIRQARDELQRLVPLLQLAIQTASQSRKRTCDDLLHASGPLRQAARLAVLAGDAAGGPGVAGSSPQRLEDVPLLMLQLVSESPLMQGESLPEMTTRDLRPSSSVSTTSLDSNDGESEGVVRLAFGRLELKDKVPKHLTLASPDRRCQQAPEILRYVSRETFMLEVPTVPPKPVNDTFEMATLHFGACPPENDDGGATLAWDAGSPADAGASATPALASACGLSSAGLHVRTEGSTQWRWHAKDAKVQIHSGDCIALLLESPAGSGNPGPPSDLEASQARCHLGVEIRPGRTLS